MSDTAGLIDIVVPVYQGLGATRRCIESVLASRCATGFELIVIDDAGPDPELSAWLVELAAAGRISLHRNPENLGFVASVNRGMALHPERDAVLLNSDTEVAGNWLDRLAACVAADPAIATATPFSNNGTICSYPQAGTGAELPTGWSVAALDAVFADVNAGCAVEIPTGVGFCLYVRRAAWQALGGFDLERFGRGYGEECDFCRRAAKAGWRNVVCADVFVYHEGSVSFGAERAQRVAVAGAVMQQLHPEYDPLVADFVRADPLRPLRDAVSRARALRACADAGQVIAELCAERDALAGKMGTELALHQEMAAVRARGRELDDALAAAERFVALRQAEVVALQAQLDTLVAQSAALQSAYKTLQMRYDTVTNSRTWRYSRRLLRLLGRS
ncbi:MAG: glycosyltransferase [Porticoccaceae bacterium]